jgi:hypothetical protein
LSIARKTEKISVLAGIQSPRSALSGYAGISNLPRLRIAAFINLFGDVSYEGGASINGPFMTSLGAALRS